jgi:hypothetical protein
MVASGRQVIRSAADAAREEAKSQGLTTDALKARTSTASRVGTGGAEGNSDEQRTPAGSPSGATVASNSEF